MKEVVSTRIALGFTLMLAGCLAGCGQSSKVGQVTGVVTLDGKPLPGALVMFSPQSGSPSAGRTDDQGKYVLDYTGEVQGAEVGQHRVTISTFRAASLDADPPVRRTPERVPAKYNSATTLTATVAAGANTLDFELESAGPVEQPDRRVREQD